MATSWFAASVVVRLHKLATLEKRLVVNRLGMLTSEDWVQVQVKTKQLWDYIQ